MKVILIVRGIDCLTQATRETYIFSSASNAESRSPGTRLRYLSALPVRLFLPFAALSNARGRRFDKPP
ncbi:MAG: hypothetical protein KF881_11270 [Acidobacteria bacterium]|nr:hypothetical protein [Acidobacteriota bacterium]